MLDNKQIGLRIKSAREELELTLQDIADKIGVTKSTIQRYEAGSIEKIKLPVISAIANSLNVDPSWLIGKTEDKGANHCKFELEDVYFKFAKEMQEKNVSEEDMKKMWAFYDMINRK